MNATLIPLSNAIPKPTDTLRLATVIEAANGTAVQITLNSSGQALAPAGQLSHVPALDVDDRVAVADSDAGPIVIGKLKAADQPAAAHVTTSETGITIESDRGIQLQCGEVTIALSADGRIQIIGDRVITRANADLLLRGAAVRIN